jgi:prepilin-type N-terminal cleavage/methylation domain-containing protein
MNFSECKARQTRRLSTRRTRERVTRRGARAGFTLIELMVAIIILVVGVLGLAGTAGMVSRMVGGAAHQTIAASVASSRFEKLRSVACADVKSGSATTRNITENWGASASPSNAKLYSVTDTITYTAAGGRSRTLTFQSYVQCH